MKPVPHLKDMPLRTYLETVNSPKFREANTLVHRALALLVQNMTLEEARGWVRAWASGAGDGAN